VWGLSCPLRAFFRTEAALKRQVKVLGSERGRNYYVEDLANCGSRKLRRPGDLSSNRAGSAQKLGQSV